MLYSLSAIKSTALDFDQKLTRNRMSAYFKVKNFLKAKLDSLKSNLQNLPSKSQWKQFFSVVSKKEKVIFISCCACFLLSLIFLCINFYQTRTEITQDNGGIYIEAIVGQPRFINPILKFSDVDRDISELLFSGLMKYEKNGDIVPDLAQTYEISEQGTIYEITLKQDIFWHDGQKITSDDVVFTIQTIQDPAFKSPEMANWIDIKVQRISEQKLIFKLKDPYFPFLERLTIKILPKHIFENIPVENFPLTIYNLQPIGSGPFKFQEIKHDKLGKIESLDLIKNENYFGKVPYLDEIKFLFFETEKEIVEAGKRKQVQGFVIASPENAVSIQDNSFELYTISLPRYFSVFLNPSKSDILEKTEVKQALNLAICKSEILEKIIGNNGDIVISPILPKLYGFEIPEKESECNLEQAKILLEQAGFVQKNGKFLEKQTGTNFSFKSKLQKESQGTEVEALQECLSFFPEIYPEAKITGYFGESTEKAVILFQEKYSEEILEPWEFDEGTGIVSETTRKKLNDICNEFSEEGSPLQLSLVTVNQAFLIETARALKEQWTKLGIEIKVKALEFNELSREFIKPREYEMLLFGEALGMIPDPLAFWHSSRIDDPGLNLAIYNNEKADDYLEKARTAQNFEEFKQNLEKFQDIVIKDDPAIFLYSPNFLYFVSKNIKGADFEIISEPSKRFLDINNWYIKTRRIFK